MKKFKKGFRLGKSGFSLIQIMVVGAAITYSAILVTEQIIAQKKEQIRATDKQMQRDISKSVIESINLVYVNTPLPLNSSGIQFDPQSDGDDANNTYQELVIEANPDIKACMNGTLLAGNPPCVTQWTPVAIPLLDVPNLAGNFPTLSGFYKPNGERCDGITDAIGNCDISGLGDSFNPTGCNENTLPTFDPYCRILVYTYWRAGCTDQDVINCVSVAPGLDLALGTADDVCSSGTAILAEDDPGGSPSQVCPTIQVLQDNEDVNGCKRCNRIDFTHAVYHFQPANN